MVWTDDEVQLLLEAAISFKGKKSYEGIDWGSVKEKSEIIKNDFLEACPSEVSRDFMESHFFREKRLQQK